MNVSEYTLDFTQLSKRRKARHYIRIRLYSVTVTKTVCVVRGLQSNGLSHPLQKYASLSAQERQRQRTLANSTWFKKLHLKHGKLA